MSLTQKLGKRGRYVKLSICHIIDNKGRANLTESVANINLSGQISLSING